MNEDRHWWRIKKNRWFGYNITVGYGMLRYGMTWFSLGPEDKAVARAKRICDKLQRKHDRERTVVRSGFSDSSRENT